MAEPYCFGRFTLHPAERSLCADGVPVPLRATDFRLLLALVESAGVYVTKDDLVSRVWGRAVVGDHVLHVHINTLRKTIGDDCIVTKRGCGYRFVTAVQPTNAVAPRAKQDPGNLPSLWSAGDSARLIGRNEQLRVVADILANGRLVTLVGHGGVGKTRLALQAADDAASHFRDGVWLVELASLHHQELVPGAIASVLGVKIGASAVALDTLPRYLARKSLLIVLDNCEHVLAACARTVEVFLSAAPNVKILATSREALSCSGEQVLAVPPLAVPCEGEVSADAVRSAAAVELFLQRSQEAHAKFRIDDRDLPTAARICRRADGLPLAIEIVAGWAGVLGLEELDARLDGYLNAKLRAKSTAPQRHSTLRATLEWSYGLLSSDEQAVLRRLAVFAGSFSLEAAEAVAGDDAIPGEQVFEHTANLVRKSMIALSPSRDARRYRLLETTRAFMLEKLGDSNEADLTRRRHAAHVLRVLEQAGCEWETTSDATWLERYGPVLNDLRAALDWAMEEDSDDAVALAGASWLQWRQMSLRAEGRQRLSAAAAKLRPDTPPALEAQLRFGLGDSLANTTAVKPAQEELERAAALYRALGDLPHLGSALSLLAFQLLTLGRIAEAKRGILEALRLLEPAGWLRTLAIAYNVQLTVETVCGRLDAARAAGEKAVRLCELAGAGHTALTIAVNLIEVRLEIDPLDEVIAAARNLAERLAETPHSELRGCARGLLTAALTFRGDPDEALAEAREAVPPLQSEGMLFWLFDHLALRAALKGRNKDAALVAGYANAMFAKSGRIREPIGRKAVERLTLLLRDALPDREIVEFDRLGAQLSEDQVIIIALEG